jgi:hypothetical protein
MPGGGKVGERRARRKAWMEEEKKREKEKAERRRKGKHEPNTQATGKLEM